MLLSANLESCRSRRPGRRDRASPRRRGCVEYLSSLLHGCPCGYFGDSERECTCSMTLVSRYQKRLSGPLLDRIDIHVEVPRVPFQKLSDERRGEASAAIRARVEAARGRQTARFAVGRGGRPSAPTATGGVKPAPTGLTCNADMGPTQVRDFCQVDETARQLLGTATLALARKCQCAPDAVQRPRPPSATASSSWRAPSRVADVGDSGTSTGYTSADHAGCDPAAARLARTAPVASGRSLAACRPGARAEC